MSWQQKTIIKILMLISLMLADDEALKKELRTLATHLQVSG